MPLVVRGKNDCNSLMLKKRDNIRLKTNKQLARYSQRYILNDDVEAWINNKFNYGNREYYDFGYGCGLSTCYKYLKKDNLYEIYYVTYCSEDGSGVCPGCQLSSFNKYAGYGNCYYLVDEHEWEEHEWDCSYNCSINGRGRGNYELIKDYYPICEIDIKDLLTNRKINNIVLDKLSPDRYEIPAHILPLYRFEKHRVWNIDGIPTIIKHVKGNIAKGFILKLDFSLEPCYVAKAYGEYAHGRSIREARSALIDKIIVLLGYDYFRFCMEEFIKTFEKAKTYKGHIFFEWHNLLTGSCLMGREKFIEENDIDLDKEYTVDEFIDICKKAYGSEIIRELKERWDEKE